MKNRRAVMRPTIIKTAMICCCIAIMAPSPSAQEMGHAALAIDRQDGFYVGWAYNYPLQSQADDRALRECNDRGGKCSIVARRAGPGCIVYRTVDSDVGTAYGWASAMHRLRADSKANAECLKRSNGQPCSNQAYSCNSDRIVKQKKPPSKPAPQAAKQPASAQQAPDATPGRTMSTLGALHRAVLFVIDKSGSMDGQKIRDAKRSAIAAAGRALDRNVQVGMLAFSGDCGGGEIIRLPFTRDRRAVSRFVNAISADGGTPLAPALREAAAMLRRAGIPREAAVTVVLADGDDDCGGVEAALAALRQQNYLNRHETVGLDVDSGSVAAQQLQTIAQTTGGNYQASAQSAQLEEALLRAVNQSVLLDLIGGFKHTGAPALRGTSRPNSAAERLRSRARRTKNN